MNTTHRIALVVGDTTRKYHGINHTFYYNSNLNDADLIEAYKKGSEIIGFDLIQDFNKDQYFHRELADKLLEMGVELGDFDGDSDYYFEDDWTYLDAFIAIARLGNPDLEMKEEVEPATISIGGASLYCAG